MEIAHLFILAQDLTVGKEDIEMCVVQRHLRGLERLQVLDGQEILMTETLPLARVMKTTANNNVFVIIV
jgi:hypothetical protein